MNVDFYSGRHIYDNSLLLVIPSILEIREKEAYIDLDFSNNLEAYLREFDTVTVACPASLANGEFPGTRTLHEIQGGDRVRLVVLPKAYREDYYFLNRRAVSQLISTEIDKSRYLLISPHAVFDWSTFAAEIAIKKSRLFNMEADWNRFETSHYIWRQMPNGLNKIRKRLWLAYQDPKYLRCLRNSTISLLQGEDVYNAYKDIAPNAFPVLNVQVTDNEKISYEKFEEKIANVRSGEPIKIVYAGRADEMKGPIHWLKALKYLDEFGVQYQATWFGTGKLTLEMRRYISQNSLSNCMLAGPVQRDEVFDALREAHIFMYCHMGKESPRCLVEAIASAAPLVGFGSDYSRSLVREHGGGAFVDLGDSESLAKVVQSLDRNRDDLARMIKEAASSSNLLDRDKAIEQRIRLMKEHL